MNAQDLFAGYDVHTGAEELVAEAALDAAGATGAITGPNAAAASTGVLTGFHGAGR
ncbi:LxmA leader domain family RiPP [Streptomyces erythrochromogenes]|uniref:LxmA leader domain family RiPP n=1 Tax=Streptomyces erythrochromogenes TaxID=285574 RepID=UPI0036B2A57C